MSQEVAGWSRWLMTEPEPDGRPLLFLLPHPGCGAETYRQWPRRVGQWQVCLVQLPAAESLNRRSRRLRYQVLAEELAAAIAQYRSRSVAVFGHREAALLAYATGVALSHVVDREPVWTILSAQPPPGGAKTPVTCDCTDAALAELMCRVILEMGCNPLPSLVEKHKRSLREDMLAAADYQPEYPATARLRLITLNWTEDIEIPPGAMHGWRDFGPTAERELPGDQYTFLSAPASLLSALEATLGPVVAQEIR